MSENENEKAEASPAGGQTGDEPFPGDPRLAEARLRARLAAEIEQGRVLQQRLSTLGERYPNHYARLNVLLTLSRLQDAHGGEFPPKLVFVHLPDVSLNIRRIGKLDPDALTAGIEVYENGDIKPGIIWLPVDQIMWAGTTDLPYGRDRVTLEEAEPPPPRNEQYEQVRRALAGLENPSKSEAEESTQGEGKEEPDPDTPAPQSPTIVLATELPPDPSTEDKEEEKSD